MSLPPSNSTDLVTRSSYPRPRVPVLPLLSWGSFLTRTSGRSAVGAPSVFDSGEPVRTTSGAAAIALALKHAGIETGDQVLVPAFHCPSMIEPVRAVDAAPVFYRIRDDTSVDLEDIEAKLTASSRALLVAHYFGFPPRI